MGVDQVHGRHTVKFEYRSSGNNSMELVPVGDGTGRGQEQ